ncbi:MAG: isoprenylcysteine carboxylmethyltransferase family protein [Synergistaceae bacterium]|jgi:protein-S-isoprenylcysteine O-methyltransferase Ste14|nr:isoprenylcysteine carboxylmethyltransferase family protein [Synergistaceae bacterium]
MPRARGLIFKYRGLLWGIFALAVLIFPVSYSRSRTLLASLSLVLGQLLRFWAAGVIPKYRTLVVGAPVLVTWGPYAWLRNPLYSGNALLGCGWALMAGWAWVAAFAAVYFGMYMIAIIPHEESFLLEKFGGEYIGYKKTTPSMIPSLGNFRERLARQSGSGAFEAGRSWFMERHSLRMNIAVTALVLARLFVLDY